MSSLVVTLAGAVIVGSWFTAGATAAVQADTAAVDRPGAGVPASVAVTLTRSTLP